ncbi:uncharacterized protein L199_000836 [Kwoniella botswanensis]|uniref:uncharacterized protein n=1 Tax=Kwoniella botswanensis TaxID=1268659 RepID=UPI00315C8843
MSSSATSTTTTLPSTKGETSSTGSISVRGVGPIDPDQKVTVILSIYSGEGGNLVLADWTVTDPLAQQTSTIIHRLQWGTAISLGRIVYDPSHGSSKYSAESAQEFLQELEPQLEMLDAAELRFDLISRRSLSFFQPDKAIWQALKDYTESFEAQLERRSTFIREKYDRFKSKDDFKLRFVDREEWCTACPPQPDCITRTIPFKLDQGRYEMQMRTQWGDSVVGDVSQVKQPKPELDTVLVPVIFPTTHNEDETTDAGQGVSATKGTVEDGEGKAVVAKEME